MIRPLSFAGRDSGTRKRRRCERERYRRIDRCHVRPGIQTVDVLPRAARVQWKSKSRRPVGRASQVFLIFAIRYGGSDQSGIKFLPKADWNK